MGAAFVAEGPDAVHRRRPDRQGRGAGAGRADPGLRRRRASRSSCIYRIVGRLRPGPGHRGFKARPGHLRRPARARARHQRRAEDDGRDHAGADRQRQPRARAPTPRPGWSSRRPPRSRSAPTSAAGGSSRRWAAASSRWTPPRASPPRAAGAAVILAVLPRGLSALHDPHDLGRGDGRRGGQAPSPRCAGAWRATSSSPGCSRCPPRLRSAAPPTASPGSSAPARPGPLVVSMLMLVAASPRCSRGACSGARRSPRGRGEPIVIPLADPVVDWQPCWRSSGPRWLAGVGVTAIFALGDPRRHAGGGPAPRRARGRGRRLRGC